MATHFSVEYSGVVELCYVACIHVWKVSQSIVARCRERTVDIWSFAKDRFSHDQLY